MTFFATAAGPTAAMRAVSPTASAPPVIPPYAPPPPLAQPFVAVEITYRRPEIGARTYALATAEAPTGAITLRPYQPEVNGILRASDMGYITRPGDAPGQVVYPPTLSAGWAITRSARLEPWGNAGAASWGSLRLIGLDGRYDALVNSSTPDGRSVRILRGTKTFDRSRGILRDPLYADLLPVFSGVGDGLWRRARPRSSSTCATPPTRASGRSRRRSTAARAAMMARSPSRGSPSPSVAAGRSPFRF
jgi:hypothetical protein